MTCIVAVKDGNCVVMGSDSASIDNDYIETGQTKSWSLHLDDEEYLIGFAGNFAEGDFIRYSFEWPEKKKWQSIHTWLVKDVQPLLQKKIKERFEDRKCVDIDWILLFCTKPGKFYILSMCGHVEIGNKNYATIGSARDTVNGVLESLEYEHSTLVSWEKVELALTIASKFHASVQGPFKINALV